MDTSTRKKTKWELLSMGVILVFLIVIPFYEKAFAQTTQTPAQIAAAANAQAQADNTDAILQNQNAHAAAAAGNTAAFTLASDQAQVDAADAAVQRDKAAAEVLIQNNASAAQMATQTAQINTDDVALDNARAALATAQGNTAAAAQDTANAQTDAAAAQSATTLANQAAGTPTPSNAGSNFVPLTNIPAITGFSNASNLTAFFNNLYKICIGVAATLAVLQIMRAGVMYMGGDSITETKQARALIGTSIGGLLLVLSPVIVFGIINPKILSLNVGFNTLTPAAAQTSGTGTAAATPTQSTSNTADGTVAPGGSCTQDINCGGDTTTLSYGCYVPSGATTGTCTLDGDAPTTGTTLPITP